MPYIKYERRQDIEGEGDSPETAGELNFKITNLILDYTDLQKGPSYKTYNEVIGVLECVKLELYRRRVAEYEDEACDKNGDVYE